VPGASRPAGRAWRLGAAATVGAVAMAVVPAAQALAATSPSASPSASQTASPPVTTKAAPDAGDPSSSGSTTVNVAISQAIVLSGLTSSFTLSGLPGDTVTDDGAVTMNVQTNNATGYNVTVEAAGPNLTDTAGDTIPVSDLQVNDSFSGGTQGFVPISSTTPTQVFSQSTPSANDGDTVTNDYQITIPSVTSGIYTGTLDYVASTNP
jgi:large repetitive protein